MNDCDCQCMLRCTVRVCIMADCVVLSVMRGWVQTGYLDVSVAHMVLVSLQRQVSVFFTNKTNQSFSVPPPLSIKTQRCPSSIQHKIYHTVM